MLRFILLFCLTASVYAQDPIKTLPNNYKLQFENEWVKITRVHYGPHEKVAKHDHISFPCTFVYLNDAGPIVFKHAGWEHPDLVRPATTTGSFRLSPRIAKNETHEVENISDTPSDLLRVEFKTKPTNRKTLIGKFKRENYPTSENLQKIEFENEMIRITRIICAPRKSIEIDNVSTLPSLFIALTKTRVKLKENNEKAKDTSMQNGDNIWKDKFQKLRFENTGNTYIEFLKFDFKTRPQKI